MIYTYRCECGAETYSTKQGDRLNQMCRSCARPGPLKRVWGFAYKQPMQPHWNNTLGRGVSGMREFNDGLKRASDEATARTGIPHNYQPVEWGDKQALGVTGEGIAESNAIRSKRGEPLLPELG